VRATTPQQDKAIGQDGSCTHFRVLIEDSGGTYRDWTELPQGDQVLSVAWGEDVDQPYIDARVELVYNRDWDNASPFVSGSRISGYLDAARGLRIEVAVLPDEFIEPQASDWVEVFDGTTVDYDLGESVARVEARDTIGEALQRAWIEESTVYGTDVGRPLADVMGDILTAWSPLSITLDTNPVPTFGVTSYNQDTMNVLESLERLAALIGFALRPKYNDSANEWRLMLEEPVRTGGSPVLTLSDWVAIPRLGIKTDWIRNVVEVYYTALSGTAQIPTFLKVEASDSASQAAYGRRWMQLTVGSSSQIDTEAEAQALADAILADLSTPVMEAGVQLAHIYWQLELGDIVTLDGDNPDPRFSADQNLAVLERRYSISERGATTTLTLSGAPKAGIQNWLAREARPGQGLTLDDSTPAAPTLTATAGNAEVCLSVGAPTDGSVDLLAIYAGASTGFAVDSASLIFLGRATKFCEISTPLIERFYVARWVTLSGVEGALSVEVSATPTFFPPSFIGSEAVSAGLIADQSSTVTSELLELAAVLAGDSGMLNAPSSELRPSYTGAYRLTAEIVSTGDGSASSWRADVEVNGSAVHSSAVATYPDPIAINILLDLAASDDVTITIVAFGSSANPRFVVEDDNTHVDLELVTLS